ncbi:MAG: hypothetical protein P1V36_00615 [Planctomycetota bacterium]|nr:hypothetical protein [Planctomycetota bacterium]
MRTLLSFALFVASSLLLAHPAGADSWRAPGPELASSEDGRWYVVVEPEDSYRDATFRLVARAKGAAPRRLLPTATGPIAIDKGDRVVARGTCTMPMEVRCLNAGKGFVLFETYAQIGSGRAVDVHDGKGALRFTRSLYELLSEERRKTLSRTVSSVWWYSGWWIDESAQELVFLWRGQDTGGVLRTTLKDGVTRDGAKTDVLPRLGKGSSRERRKALEQAIAWKLPGTLGAVVEAFEDQSAPMLARLHFAKYLLDRGDERGKAIFAAGAQSEELEVRRVAVKYLPLALGSGSLSLLKEAMRSKDRELRDSAEFAFRHMGALAVPTLIEMLGETVAPESYRTGAATALWNMPVEVTLPAEAALAKAAKSPLKSLARAASHAHRQIVKYKRKAK